ncbi:MAG: AraC family transcriptional regulator [Verrucomicrobiaceae bacterium]|nr:AraC family transcriptional regulator [Verrucomicrobiaceae bacterium]
MPSLPASSDSTLRTRFLADLGQAVLLPEALFDALPDVVFFIKDKAGRYVTINQTFANRCASGSKDKLIGKRPEEVFPPALAASYARQDATVLQTGNSIDGQLELHLYPGGISGWCLTTKHPLRSPKGDIVGIAGISRDLDAPDHKTSGFANLSKTLTLMRHRYAESLRIEDLATHAGLSVYQFEQRIQRLFQMSPLQLLHKIRLDEAVRLLDEGKLSLGDIALQTGWCDQSAFTRHFSRYAGMTPGRYRTLRQ